MLVPPPKRKDVFSGLLVQNRRVAIAGRRAVDGQSPLDPRIQSKPENGVFPNYYSDEPGLVSQANINSTVRAAAAANLKLRAFDVKVIPGAQERADKPAQQ